MAYPTDQERRLLRALETLLAFTDDDSIRDQQTDARLREEFRAARQSAEQAVATARHVLQGV